MSVRVRAATVSDGHAVGALHAASWRYAYRGALSDKYLSGEDLDRDRMHLWRTRLAEPAERQHLLLAEDVDRLLGFVCFYGSESEEWGSYLNNIHVAQTAQGLGIGRLLLHSTAELCGSAYPGGLYLWVLESNTRAQGFYARYGGRNSGTGAWEAPGGTVAPVFRFSWADVDQLRGATADPSFQRTAIGGR